jgi:lipoic acid synthetase
VPAILCTCIQRIRALAPTTTTIPDARFWRTADLALDILGAAPLGTCWNFTTSRPYSRLYKEAPPGVDFQHHAGTWGCKRFKEWHPAIPDQVRPVVGLGETDDEILDVPGRCVPTAWTC